VPNYLVGVEFEVDPAAGTQSAVIPCLPNLMEAIGKVLVEKKTPLSADELRFLRKRLRFASKAFAEVVGLSSEQYSRVENGAAKVTPTVERVVRLLYAALARLSPDESLGVIYQEIVVHSIKNWDAEVANKWPGMRGSTSTSSVSSPTTAPATPHATSNAPAHRSGSSTDAPGLTLHGRTERPNASSKPRSKNGPTREPIKTHRKEPKRCYPSTTSTTGIDRMPASNKKHPSPEQGSMTTIS